MNNQNPTSVKIPISNSRVRIPNGQFLMGAEEPGWGETEYPTHNVIISSFELDAYPVTNARFSQFVTETIYITTTEQTGGAIGFQDGTFRYIEGLCWRTFSSTDRAEHPVVLTSWHDAQAYCCWAGCRLPTEAEWEYAARGGLIGKSYPWGTAEPTLIHVAISQPPGFFPGTRSVGLFAPNGFGLYDIVGHVWQLCQDRFSPDYYQISPSDNPQGPDWGSYICRRGGAFNIIQSFRCRCANRGAFPPDGVAINVGFRCAWDLK